jgi:hypothetical protein
MSSLSPVKRREGVSLQRKVAVAKAWPIDKARGLSLKEYARQQKVQPVQVRKWVAQLETLEEKALELGGKRASTNTGRESSLATHKKELFQWLFELRQDGMPVSVRMFVLRACQLDNVFRKKKEQTRYGICRRLLLANDIVLIVD